MPLCFHSTGPILLRYAIKRLIALRVVLTRKCEFWTAELISRFTGQLLIRRNVSFLTAFVNISATIQSVVTRCVYLLTSNCSSDNLMRVTALSKCRVRWPAPSFCAGQRILKHCAVITHDVYCPESRSLDSYQDVLYEHTSFCALRPFRCLSLCCTRWDCCFELM